jgi:large subunit ribosomal protein L25
MTITLGITERDAAQKNEAIRSAGAVPGNVYGPKQAPLSVTVEAKALRKVLDEAGESTIIELTGLKEPIEVLVKEVDFDPVKQAVQHVDFYAIERGKEMTTHVALEFIGTAPVEKSGGVVTRALHEVEVTCLPSKLPAHLDIDLSVLTTLDSRISVSDIVVPEGVQIENDPEDVVAVVSEAKEEVDEAPEAVDMSAIQVEEKGKKEEAAAE